MYTQFFGNYLLSHGYVTQDQLFSAMQREADARMRLGTLAINSGFMTAQEVDDVIIAQTHEGKKFGEIAVEYGYLTEEQVMDLLREQSPDFLLLGQVLVDDGIITNSDFENIIADYRSENEILDLDITSDNHEIIRHLIENLFNQDSTMTIESKSYFELLFNDFVRFVGEDFTPLPADKIKAFPVDKCIRQEIQGNYQMRSFISMDEETAIAFASRYVGDTFTEYDEYVQASLEDFLNLHNGLFIVNISNDSSIELTITAPELVEDPILDFDNPVYHFQVLYSFGIVHFLIEIV